MWYRIAPTKVFNMKSVIQKLGQQSRFAVYCHYLHAVLKFLSLFIISPLQGVAHLNEEKLPMNNDCLPA